MKGESQRKVEIKKRARRDSWDRVKEELTRVERCRVIEKRSGPKGIIHV